MDKPIRQVRSISRRGHPVGVYALAGGATLYWPNVPAWEGVVRRQTEDGSPLATAPPALAT